MTTNQHTITITYTQLKAKRACTGLLAIFKERFGDSVTVTRDDVGDMAQGFDIEWLACALLPAPLLDVYERLDDLLWVEFDHKPALIQAEYDLQRAIVFFDLYLQQETA